MTISAELASTIAELKASISSLNALVESLKSDNEYLKNNNDLLREENAYLKRKLFGVKSEKMPCSVEQLSLFDEAEQECEPELLEEITYKRAKKKQKGTLEIKLDNLKHVKEVYDIDEKDRICDICGTKMHRVGEEFVRHEVVYEPAKLYVKDIYRKTYECRDCRKRGKVVMLKAGTPAPVIPHSFTSPSVLSQVITDKFVNHMPLYRQEAEWKRLGLDLSRTTMANWLIIASREYFIPIVNRMHEILVEEKYLHSDETPVQVLNEPGKPATSKSYMWVYSSIRESSKPIRIFEYKPDRKAENPQKFLENFSGTLISDGYGGYNNIEGVVNAYCWAHARRKFYEALPADMKDASDTLAYTGLKKIAKLFAIEKEIDTFPPEDKVKIRQEKSKPLVDDFFSWCADAQNKSLTRSKIGKAIQYALNLEKGLRVYLDDGLVPMTNSLNERNIRPFTVSRKNWLFSASTKGADASASIFSLIETAKANRLSPFDYIEYILEIMPQIDIIQHPEKIDWFMPWSDQIKEEFGIKDD
ncbi:IS66 family transposase [Catenibacterium mitsuokai]|uniref:IS66 family transposase n=1 Tax=Catenibacterium mitsuokai TaxID=100886 RepID=UPI003F8B9DC9